MTICVFYNQLYPIKPFYSSLWCIDVIFILKKTQHSNKNGDNCKKKVLDNIVTFYSLRSICVHNERIFFPTKKTSKMTNVNSWNTESNFDGDLFTGLEMTKECTILFISSKSRSAFLFLNLTPSLLSWELPWSRVCKELVITKISTNSIWIWNLQIHWIRRTGRTMHCQGRYSFSLLFCFVFFFCFFTACSDSPDFCSFIIYTYGLTYTRPSRGKNLWFLTTVLVRY